MRLFFRAPAFFVLRAQKVGLRRREMVKTFPDNPAVRCMIAKVSHLVVEVTKA